MDGYLRLLGVLGGEISMKGDEHGIKVGDDVRLDGVGRRSNQTDAQLTHPTRDTNKLIKSVLAISIQQTSLQEAEVLRIRIRMDPHLKRPPGPGPAWTDADADPDPGGKKA